MLQISILTSPSGSQCPPCMASVTMLLVSTRVPPAQVTEHSPSSQSLQVQSTGMQKILKILRELFNSPFVVNNRSQYINEYYLFAYLGMDGHYKFLHRILHQRIQRPQIQHGRSELSS